MKSKNKPRKKKASQNSKVTKNTQCNVKQNKNPEPHKTNIVQVKDLVNKARTYLITKVFHKGNFKKVVKHKLFIPATVGIAISIAVGVTAYDHYIINVKNAELYYYSADYNKAIFQYTKLFERNKTSLMAAKVADAYSVKGEINNSRIFIDKAKASQEKDAQALYYIVFDELMNKDFKLALTDGKQAIKQYPEDKKLKKLMFTVYMANNQGDNAKDIIQKYNVDEKSAYDMAEHSRMVMIIGQWDNGLKELRKAWDIDKDEYKIYDVLSQISVFNKDELLQKISKLEQENKDDIAYKMWKVKIYSLDESTASDAKKLLEALKGKATGNLEIKLIEATILQNTGNTNKADELIKKITMEKGGDYRIFHTTSWLYLTEKNYEKAEQYCKQSIEKNKDYPDNYGFLMPEILKGKNKLNISEPYFRTAVFKEPYNYNMILNAANYYQSTLKNLDKAFDYFSLAAMIKPEETEIKYNMALIQITNKKEGEAIKLLKECTKLKDIVPKYHRTLGTLYFTNGQNEEAIKEIRYAYNVDKNDIMTLNNAGCYYLSVDGNVERGYFNLRKAKEGIDKNTDQYTKDTITDNFNKAKKLYDAYDKSKSDDSLTVPDFVLFY